GSESPYYPRIVLCIPGTWSGRDELDERLRQGPFRLAEPKVVSADGAESFDAEVRGPDLRMRAAFQASACRVRPSMTPADFAAVQGHRSVVYVLSDPFGRSTAAAAAARMIEVGLALLDAGGITMKCESSGIAHSAERWRRIGARLREEGAPGAALFDAFVRLPIVDDNQDLYSCGMHLLGSPDGLLSLRDFPGEDVLAAHRVLEGFLRRLRTGPVELQQAFQGEGTEDRFTSILEPCTRYEADDFFWNRWGCFRLRKA
ncbi:MAG: hypothetical protein HY293_11070, partial [Planctomycetes bacterium]|nr:hypothetical protein [Planctomycetota bacterium]